MSKKKREMVEESLDEHASAPEDNGDKAGVLKGTSEEEDNEEGKTDVDDVSEETEEEKDPIAALEEQLYEQKDKYLRLMAEFDNYKRRTSKEYERIIGSANERLMLDIIEVRENFDRALSMADEKHDFSSFLEGMKLIFSKFDEILSKNGLVVFTEIGDEFNPEIHDAMMKIPNQEIPEDHIVQIYEKGYTLKGRVIKHAKVIVSAGAAPEDEKNEDENKQPEESELPATEE